MNLATSQPGTRCSTGAMLRSKKRMPRIWFREISEHNWLWKIVTFLHVQVPIVEIIYCRVCHREPLLRTRFLHVLRWGEVGKYHTEGEIFRHGTIGGIEESLWFCVVGNLSLKIPLSWIPKTKSSLPSEMKDAQYVHREYLSLNTKFYLSLPSQLLSHEQRNEEKKTSKDSSNIWKMAACSWHCLWHCNHLGGSRLLSLWSWKQCVNEGSVSCSVD